MARDLRVSQNRINELIRGKRGITAETALLLATYFGNSAEFWMNLQSVHDLNRARQEFRFSGRLWRKLRLGQTA